MENLNLVTEIMQLCVEITNTTKSDAFFNFSGHINAICVSVHIDGWSNDINDVADIIAARTVSIDNSDDLQTTLSKLKYLKKGLTNA